MVFGGHLKIFDVSDPANMTDLDLDYSLDSRPNAVLVHREHVYAGTMSSDEQAAVGVYVFSTL